MGILARIVGWITGGALDRVLTTVDRKIASETDRAKLKADLTRAYLETRPSFMKAGGFILMLLFAIPLAFWFAAVCVYSVFWCAGCAYPVTWSIAALPAPLDEWGGLIVVSIFGLIGVTQFRK